jgi:biopolymer transport protein ExbB
MMVESNILLYAENILDYGVMGILVLMSVVTLWLFIERMMFYKSVRIEDYEYRDNLELDLTDNISVISAIGSNAPYVGLLGTVVGIMITFYTMGDVGAVDAKKIMLGLALALKATAMGLVVAMPAIVTYTITLRKVERILTKFDVAQEAKKSHGKV